jgi:hypothetical protein
MPKVGKKKFPYTPDGVKAAKAERTLSKLKSTYKKKTPMRKAR